MDSHKAKNTYYLALFHKVCQSLAYHIHLPILTTYLTNLHGFPVVDLCLTLL